MIVAMTDGWQRVTPTSAQKGPWTVARVTINGVETYECRRDSLAVLARCGSFMQARQFVEAFDKKEVL
jgi:hypothetical protein